jgi:hypothetical protein
VRLRLNETAVQVPDCPPASTHVALMLQPERVVLHGPLDPPGSDKVPVVSKLNWNVPPISSPAEQPEGVEPVRVEDPLNTPKGIEQPAPVVPPEEDPPPPPPQAIVPRATTKQTNRPISVSLLGRSRTED